MELDEHYVQDLRRERLRKKSLHSFHLSPDKSSPKKVAGPMKGDSANPKTGVSDSRSLLTVSPMQSVDPSHRRTESIESAQSVRSQVWPFARVKSKRRPLSVRVRMEFSYVIVTFWRYQLLELKLAEIVMSPCRRRGEPK